MGNHIQGRQLRAARVALGLSIKDLSALTGLSGATVARLEAGGGGCRRSSFEAILGALEMRGCRFFAGGVSFPPDINMVV
jgi:predicted transcriptional regulator